MQLYDGMTKYPTGHPTIPLDHRQRGATTRCTYRSCTGKKLNQRRWPCTDHTQTAKKPQTDWLILWMTTVYIPL